MDGTAVAPKIVTPADAARELKLRRKVRTTLHEFLKEAWSAFEFGREFTDSWAVGAMSEHCQAVIEGEIEDLLINIPPRSTKSTLVSVCLVPWAWINWPELQCLCGSYAAPVANNDHVKCRRLIESEWYATIAPHITLADDQNTKTKFDNTSGGYRTLTATDGSTTGQGGDLIIIDDPNNAKDISDTALNNVLHWWRDVLPTRVNDAKNAMKIVVQQRVHENDVSGEIMRNGGPTWVKLILPMEFETNRRCITTRKNANGEKITWMDPRVKDGELLFPERVDQRALEKMKRPMSQYARAGQLQQRPAPAEGGIIKRKFFPIWDQPTPPPFEIIAISVDTAMTEEDSKTNAQSAATAWGVFRAPKTGIPSVMLLSVWQDHAEYPDLRRRVRRMANNYLDTGPLYDALGNETKPKARTAACVPGLILVEAKNNGISLIQELRKTGIPIQGFNPDKLGDKTARVRLVTPMLESQRVWLPGSPASNYKELRPFAQAFLDQAIKFPNASARDLVDTMTQILWRLHMSGWIWNADDPGEEETYTNPEEGGDEPIYG
jgi:hypothetical protein